MPFCKLQRKSHERILSGCRRGKIESYASLRSSRASELRIGSADRNCGSANLRPGRLLGNGRPGVGGQRTESLSNEVGCPHPDSALQTIAAVPMQALLQRDVLSKVVEYRIRLGKIHGMAGHPSLLLRVYTRAGCYCHIVGHRARVVMQ